MRSAVDCEMPQASSFRQQYLPLEYRQERDMPASRAMGDNVKTEMQTPVRIGAIREWYGLDGASEILVLASPFRTIGPLGSSCYGLQRF
jgi:hypothetical protein